MAVLDLGLSDNATTSAYASLMRFTESWSPSSIYVVFSTEQGTNVQKYVDVSCSFRYVKRPGDAGSDNGWSDWSQFYWSRLNATDCRPHNIQYDSRVHWAVELSQIGQYLSGGTDPNPDGSIKNMLFPNGYALQVRKYDAIEIQVHVKTIFQDDYDDGTGATQSELAQNNSIVFSYVPNYYLKAIDHYDAYAIQVAYDAPAWQRNDDRYALEKVYNADTGENLLRSGNFYGPILGYNGGRGYIRIGSNQLTRMPGSDENIGVRIRMNAGFNQIEQWFQWLEGVENINDSTVCSTPLLEVMKADVDSVQIRLHDLHDADYDYQQAVCGLVNEVYETDLATVDNGGLYTIYNPPLGVEFEVYASGFYILDTQTLYSKQIAKITVPPIDGQSKMFIAPLNTGFNPVEIRYNISENWTFEPTQESVKFATRSFDSVAFGFGGSSTGTLEFDIVDDKRYGEAMYQDRKDFEDLLFAGMCILRGPDGERRRVAIESVDMDWDRYRRFRTVKLSMREIQ